MKLYVISAIIEVRMECYLPLELFIEERMEFYLPLELAKIKKICLSVYFIMSVGLYNRLFAMLQKYAVFPSLLLIFCRHIL